METPKIIDGLKDLIKDRDSFIDQDEPDNVFEYDKDILNAAIDALSAAPENKPTTHCRDCTNYRPLSDYTGRGKCPYYNEQFDVGDDHFCGYAVAKARQPEGSEKA
ncbi:MAG: hypothetical protein LKK39_05210 [Oscillospiraceae bacterium]|jgi:hypothetical protein|nr:hypothetical protein [Oscillospiraceae bacterium]MCI2191698.1 hypothetical protein [Oscillospiraceae bacterium]MCI2205665.1 hypothetical protein [Oscillospiraceae bacterium]